MSRPFDRTPMMKTPGRAVTLDVDAHLVESSKSTALWTYQKFRGYQPMVVCWAETGLVLADEFRDGNVPAGHEQLRVFQESLAMLPEGVERVRLRSDTAGYQHDLLAYCDDEDSPFGRIEFAISCDVTRP